MLVRVGNQCWALLSCLSLWHWTAIPSLISDGGITACIKCRRYGDAEWWDDFGNVVGESLIKAIEENIEKGG
jgi:hypothetical protein